MKLFLTLTVPFYILDQVTKALVLRYIGTEDVIPVIPGFFNLVQVHNTGAAFGMLSNNNHVFLVLLISAMIGVVVLWKRGAFKDTLASRIAAALLLAGIAGNLTDRILHGFVVDFLDFVLPWYGHWPSFNVADSCICAAAGLFIISSLLEGRKVPKTA
jgi:signal peptidase II